MKKIVFVISALATLVTSPALAASNHRAQRGYDADDAQAAAPYAGAPYGNDTVTFGGRVIGQDPDPNIRSQLRHDPTPNAY